MRLRFLLSLVLTSQLHWSGFSATARKLRLQKIDLHTHFIPDFYKHALELTGSAKKDGIVEVPSWSEHDHMQLMDELNITKSVLSISSPGVALAFNENATQQTIALAQKCNDYASKLKQHYPDRFGFFAALPLPDIAASIEEVKRAYASGCDGIGMLTSYGSIFQGDQKLEPLYAELNAHNAVVFLHPTTSCNPLDQKFPSSVMEFLFDTARAVVNLLLSGTTTRYPNITWVAAHAGGALPSIFSRITGYSQIFPGNLTAMTEEAARKILNEQFYFDLAGWSFPGQWTGVVSKDLLGVSIDRLVYGGDFPFTPAAVVKQLASTMQNVTERWNPIDQAKVYEANAQKLLKKERT